MLPLQSCPLVTDYHLPLFLLTSTTNCYHCQPLHYHNHHIPSLLHHHSSTTCKPLTLTLLFPPPSCKFTNPLSDLHAALWKSVLSKEWMFGLEVTRGEFTGFRRIDLGCWCVMIGMVSMGWWSFWDMAGGNSEVTMMVGGWWILVFFLFIMSGYKREKNKRKFAAEVYVNASN